MDPNFMIDFLRGMFRLEIANPTQDTEHAIIMRFPNREKIIISAQPVAPTYQAPAAAPTEPNNYVLQHDFGYGRDPELRELIKLTLRNREDLYAYIADACQTQLLATFDNFHVILNSGPHYLITFKSYPKG